MMAFCRYQGNLTVVPASDLEQFPSAPCQDIDCHLPLLKKSNYR
jgi:hypothetical protein